MSELPLIFSPEVVKDIDAIWDYTVELFGILQANRIVDDIHQAFDLIHAHPHSMPVRREIGEEIRLCIVGPFVIVYQIGKQAIRVAAVYHGSVRLRDRITERL